MNIIVLVKQVPATDKVKMDEKTGTMVRSGLDMELNPLDLHAIEEAVRMKEKRNAKVTVISMGPPPAKYAVKDAIAMGCDEGYLLSDPKFAGADTLATAYTLARFIESLGKFDLIFAGERATDGETGQVGPSVAAQLGIPVVTFVSRIIETTDEKVRVRRSVEGGCEFVEVELPAVLTVVRELNDPRLPNLEGKLRAKRMDVPVIGFHEGLFDPNRIGLNGSPTRVKKIFYPKITRKTKLVKAHDPEKAVEELLDFLKERGFIG
ncbi:MAG: electron transfer flavoprotein subunit beta [Thermotoga sp.]|nr:MAG: electron transfer flavoprotein subunit beta [Thermotoga sp.]